MRIFARPLRIFAAALLAGLAHATAADLPRVMILGDKLFATAAVTHRAPGMKSFRVMSKRAGGVPADKIRENIRIGHMCQVARIVERLKPEPEGKGTMFDNTMIMYFPEGGETHHGHGTEALFVIMAGNNCKLDIAGRYIRLPYHGTEGHKTIGNWYTTLLNAHGNPIKHYGDFDLEMSRKKLDQSGAIKRFLA